MNTSLSSTTRRLILAACAVAFVGVLTRCSTPQPTTDAAPSPEEPAAPSGPALAFLYTDDSGLQMHDARTASTTTVMEDVQFAGTQAVSPSGNYVAMSYEADSSYLGIVDLRAQTLQPVHARATGTYSVAWHPSDDTLAYGVYTPTNDGSRGPGTIRWAPPTGSGESVGCRAAREVLAWLSDGTLATRDDDNLYLVAPDGCGTQASLDIRKMHHLTFSADGEHLAYMLRDLEYDRSAGEYLPDSTLYLSDADGENAESLFGNDRAVRHLRWAPDDTELAFDLKADDSDRRDVVVYDVAQERTNYVVPPSEAASDRTDPRWSPDGARVAFTLRRTTGRTAAVRVDGQTRTLGETTGPVSWAGPQHIVVPGPDSLRVSTVRGQAVYTLPGAVDLIHATAVESGV